MQDEIGVIASIQPQWCRLILPCIKTLEIRKTAPNLKPPFKVWTYCTLAGSKSFFCDNLHGDVAAWNKEKWEERKGHVICEFTCDRIDKLYYDSDILYGIDHPNDYGFKIMETSRLTLQQIADYFKCKDGYGWHISDLVVYERPLEISEFIRPCSTPYQCESCEKLIASYGCAQTIRRPPQSWCYAQR